MLLSKPPGCQPDGKPTQPDCLNEHSERDLAFRQSVSDRAYDLVTLIRLRLLPPAVVLPERLCIGPAA